MHILFSIANFAPKKHIYGGWLEKKKKEDISTLGIEKTHLQ